MEVEGSDRMLIEMKSDFSQLNPMGNSHSASINQLETQFGQISAHLNARQKGGLPSNTVDNLKNDSHIMKIITKSGRTHGNDIVSLDKEPNKRESEEQDSRNRKRLDKSHENVTYPNITSVEKLRVV